MRCDVMEDWTEMKKKGLLVGQAGVLAIHMLHLLRVVPYYCVVVGST